METYNPRQNYNIPNLYDFGPYPLVVNIERYANYNENFRTALWTGNHLQLTLMEIPVMGDIGIEMHPDTDQFIRISEGNGLVKMGNRRDNLSYHRRIDDEYAVIIPAGTWHNLINIGNTPLKLYSVYAPPQHPFGTVHSTKEAAEDGSKSD